MEREREMYNDIDYGSSINMGASLHGEGTFQTIVAYQVLTCPRKGGEPMIVKAQINSHRKKLESQYEIQNFHDLDNKG